MNKPSIAHFVYVPFTGVGLHGGMRGEAWLKRRIEIFKAYTLKSLLNQTNRDFTLWLSFRPEEYKNPQVQELLRFLSEKIRYVATFENLMYWDDKYTDYRFKTVVRNFMMMVWDCYKYKELKNPFKMLRLSTDNKNKTLVERLGRALPTLYAALVHSSPRKEDVPYDWVYLSRIDSDDMFHKKYIEEVRRVHPKERMAMIFLKGYGYNIVTKQLADWRSPLNANPPYHTIVFPWRTFFTPLLHAQYYREFKSHEDIPRVFDPVYMNDNRYCFTMHGRNISTSWTSYLMKIQNSHIFHEYPDRERKIILREFGIDT